MPEPTIVVVMALHGGVDAEGAYLLPQDAKALPEAKDRLRMTEVIRLFGSLPRSKKKVLILDATGMPYHWELGMLRNDFALELKKLEPEIKKIPNFVVISASDEGQRSWASDAWGRTAFLHFLTRALGGEADRSPARSGQAPGGRVNLEQVFDYLAIHVRNWAAIHCNAPQEPLILPSGEAGRRVARSIELPSIRGLEEPKSPESKELSSIEQAINGPWENYRKLAASVVQPGVAAPISWRRYQQLLCRYQELLRASGRSGEGDYADIVSAIEAQQHQIEQSSNHPAQRGAIRYPDDPRRRGGDRVAWRGARPRGTRAGCPELVRQELVAARRWPGTEHLDGTQGKGGQRRHPEPGGPGRRYGSATGDRRPRGEPRSRRKARQAARSASPAPGRAQFPRHGRARLARQLRRPPGATS